MPYKEKEIEKLYWTIGEIAEELGVQTSKVRFWADNIPMIEPKRDRQDWRKFNKQEREMIHTAHRLRTVEETHTVKGVIEYLKLKERELGAEELTKEFIKETCSHWICADDEELDRVMSEINAKILYLSQSRSWTIIEWIKKFRDEIEEVNDAKDRCKNDYDRALFNYTSALLMELDEFLDEE
jgi:DNA-binding transcriptional MerR regulator